MVPGGGIEREEEAPQAAMRETKEEAGAEGKILRFVADFVVSFPAYVAALNRHHAMYLVSISKVIFALYSLE